MGMGETQTAALAVQCGRCNSKVTSGVGGGAQRMQAMVGRILGGCRRGGNTGGSGRVSCRGGGGSKIRGAFLFLPYPERVNAIHSFV